MKIETYLELVVNRSDAPYHVVTSCIDSDKVDIRIRGKLKSREISNLKRHISAKLECNTSIDVQTSELGYTDVSFLLPGSG